MSVDTIIHPCICLDKAPLFVDGDTDAIYHEKCNGFIGDICDIALNDKFWNMQLVNRNNAVVIKGVQYRIGSTVYPKKGNGMGGRNYKIKKYIDGEIIDTADLWCQGTIPEEYRFILQDNATFVRKIKVNFGRWTQ